MRPWKMKCALIALYALPALTVGAVAHAEGDTKTVRSGHPTARVDFRVTVPHYLDIRVAPLAGATQAAATLLEKVRNSGLSLPGAIGDAAALSVDTVSVASNRGQVIIAERRDRLQGPSLARGVADDRATPALRVMSVAFSAAHPFGAPGASAAPTPDRAGVTQHKAAWLHAYSREAGLVPATGRAGLPDAAIPTTFYIAVVP
jgi:hypothetical protein